MVARYDIFKILNQGSPVWVGTVATRGEVEQTLNALEWVNPGDYFIREAVSGEIVQGIEPGDLKDGNGSKIAQL